MIQIKVILLESSSFVYDEDIENILFEFSDRRH